MTITNVSEFDIPVGFKVDIGEIQDDQYRELSNIDDLPEDRIEEVQTSVEVEEDEPVEENEYKDYSDSALIAISEIRDGLFPGIEEDDIPKDLNPEALRDLYRKSNEIRRNEEILNIRNEAGEAGKYIEYLLNGGDPDIIKDSIKLQDLIKLDTDQEENQKKLIRADFIRKGVDEDEIEDLIENILDKGKGKQKSDQIVAQLKKEDEDFLQESIRQRRLQEDEQKRVYDEYVSNIKNTIQKAEVNGIKISKAEQKSLESAIFTPTELVEVRNPDTGKLQKIRATKIQVLQHELNNNYEKLVSFYYWLSKGGKFDFVKDQVIEEEHDNLRSVLQGRVPQKKSKIENGQDKILNALKSRK